MTVIFFSPFCDDRIIIDDIEHSFPKSNTLILEKILSVITLILINTTNGGLINVIMSKPKSALDWMMLIDSFLCVLNSVVIIRQGIIVTTHPDNVPLCVLFNFFVIRYTFVERNLQRQIFVQSLFLAIFITSFALTGYAIYFKDLYQDHLCKIKLK